MPHDFCGSLRSGERGLKEPEQSDCQALGPADYLSLASTFDTFYIDAVPVLYLRNKNEARRLINLIDALCESGLALRGKRWWVLPR